MAEEVAFQSEAEFFKAEEADMSAEEDIMVDVDEEANMAYSLFYSYLPLSILALWIVHILCSIQLVIFSAGST